MPDPTTPAKGLTQPQVGGDNNAWGGLLNTDLSLIDTALGGTVSISISGSTTSITSTEAQSTGYEFIGSLMAQNTITWPAFFGIATINNQTSGGYPLSCGISGGSYASILSGEVTAIWSDGTNFVRLSQPIYPGEMRTVAFTSAPSGWLYCDGSAVSRTTYAALFNKIETTFGPGDGSTTFNLPDMRGRVPAGYDNGDETGRLTESTSQGVSASTLGNVGGEQAHTQTVGEIPPHDHTFFNELYAAVGGIGTFAGPGASDYNVNSATANTGGGNAFNVVQPTLIVGWIIKT